MISITKIPPRVHFATNGLPFEAATDNLYINEGQKCFFVLGKSSNPLAVGNSFVFSWGDNSVTLVAVSSPDDSGLQIPAGNSNTLIGNAIAANYLLSRDFSIVVSASEISFEARSAGAIFDMQVTINAPAYSLYSYNPGVDAVKNQFFSIIAQVLANDPAIIPDPPKLLGIDKITPGIDQLVIFDPADYILPWFDYSFQFPVSSIFVLHPKAICPYFIKLSEQYGSPPVSKKVVSGSVFFALPGILDDQKQLGYNQANQSWWQQLPYTRSFISNSPTDRFSSIDVPEKLWFLCYHNYSGTSSIVVNVTLDNGNTYSFNKGSVSMSKYQVYEVNVGYKALDIQGFINSYHPGKSCVSWSVHIVCGSQVVSESKLFVIDDRFNIFERIFIFKNQFGFFEAIRTTGKAVTKNSVSRDVTYNYKPTAFDPVLRNRFSSSFDLSESIELASGYFKNFDSAFWAAEAFRSNSVFEICNGILVPVVIMSDEIIIRKDGEFAYAFSFEYARAFNGVVFPNPAAVNPGNGDFNDDFNNDFSIQ